MASGSSTRTHTLVQIVFQKTHPRTLNQVRCQKTGWVYTHPCAILKMLHFCISKKVSQSTLRGVFPPLFSVTLPGRLSSHSWKVDLFLSKTVNFAISSSSIIFINYSSIMGVSESFHFCAYSSLGIVILYKNNLLWLFPSCLSINLNQKSSGFNWTLVFKFLCFSICFVRQNLEWKTTMVAEVSLLTTLDGVLTV